MKEFKILKWVDKLKGAYEKLGVDYETMRLILQTKLTMDGRRSTTFMGNMGKDNNKTKDKNQFFTTLGWYAFLGVFIAPILLIKLNIMYQMTIIFIYFMFMVLTTFISDFSTVLLDLKDKYLLGTKGVGKSTLNAAKLTHIMIYVIYLSLALVGFSLLASLKLGVVFFIIFLLEILLVDLFMICITALAYFLVLKFFDGEKLKDMINVIQIILSLVLVVGYQIVPRIFEFADFTVTFTPKVYQLLIPPMWFAAPLYILQTGELNTILIIMSAFAVIIPLGGIILYIKNSSTFESYLEKLNSDNGTIIKSKKSLSYKLDKLICSSNEEKTFFNFSWQMMKSERNFKLKAYPNLILCLVFPILFLVIGYQNQGFENMLSDLRDSNSFLTGYLIIFVMPNVAYMVRYSENYKAASIFKTCYLKDKSAILKGTIKAFIVKLIVPIWLLLTVIYSVLFGVRVIPHMIIILLVAVPSIFIVYKLTGMKLPFAEEFKVSQGAGYIGVGLACLALAGIAAGLHAVIVNNIILVVIAIVILAVIDIVLIEKKL